MKSRLGAIRAEPDGDDECNALKNSVALIEANAEASRVVKDIGAALDSQVPACYLTLDERKTIILVVADKWLAGIRAAIKDEVRCLTARVQEIVDRSARTMSELERDLGASSANTEGCLTGIGLSL